MKTLKTISKYTLAFFMMAAGVNHFWHPDFYVHVMPPYLPFPLELVYLSGAIEVALGALLLDPLTRVAAAWGIVAMLIVFDLVHIHMVLHAMDYPEAHPAFLWFRLPLQALFIAWAWWHTRPDAPEASS